MKLIGCDGVHSDQSVILDALVLLDTTISRNKSNTREKKKGLLVCAFAYGISSQNLIENLCASNRLGRIGVE